METGCAIREDFPSNTRSDSTLDTRAFSTGHGLRCIIFIHTTIGVRWALNDRFALLAGLNWQHISNAGINPPNPGLDTLGVRLGFEIQ